ncbi:hypothetical protein [Acidovorax sp. SDU_ACID1]|uniref:hypothetical protein n=1 Tax=Acidovorax sp. SDU_ACID1 TaxID=3136632 RepID=UPI003872BFF0
MERRQIAAAILVLAACAAQAAPTPRLPAAQASEEAAADGINLWGLFGMLAALGAGMAAVGLHGRALARREAHEDPHTDPHADQAEGAGPRRRGSMLWKP